MPTLRHFMPYSPMELMTGPVGEWITLIVVTAMFISLAYAVLPKHLSQNNKGKALAVTVGLIMGLGLYMVKRTFNFSFESFGLFGIFIIIFIMALIGYNLLKNQFSKEISVCLTYDIIFLSIFMLSPSLFDAFSYSFPLLNGILFLSFFVSLGFLIWRLISTMLKSATNGEPLIKIETVDPNKLQKNYDDHQKDKKESKGGNQQMMSELEAKLEKISFELELIITELNAMNGWIENKESKRISKRLAKLIKTKKSIKKEYGQLVKEIKDFKDVNKEADPKLIKHNHDLKNSLHDFYKKLELGNDFIKKNAIKYSIPEIKKALENLVSIIPILKSIQNILRMPLEKI